MSEIPAEAASLFRAAPEDFIERRNELVNALRADGRDDQAAAVKALRKPTIAAWGLDQLAAQHPAELEQLFAAGRGLRAAQQAALAGTGGDAMLVASTARKAAVATLTAATVAVIDAAGGAGDAHHDAIATALEVASVDPEAGAQLASGTIQKPPTSVSDLGLGGGAAVTVLRGGKATAASEDTGGTSRAEAARLRREAVKARKFATSRRESADRLAAQVEDLRQRLASTQAEHAAAETAALEAQLDAERAEQLVEKD